MAGKNLGKIKASDSLTISVTFMLTYVIGMTLCVIPTTFKPCTDFINNNFQVEMVTFSTELKEGELIKIVQTGRTSVSTILAKLEL